MRLSRPVILTFVGHYLPGYKAGGPIRTISQMVDQLSDAFEFKIVAADRDLGDREPYPGISVNCWSSEGRASVFYRAPGFAGWAALLRSLRSINYDVIYLNSIFSTDAAIIPLLAARIGKLKAKPLLIAPRGELGEGALKLKKLKKSVFLNLVHWFGLFSEGWWQGSSIAEKDRIIKVLGIAANKVFVSPDLGSLPSEADDREFVITATTPIRVIFLSRISRMKNLDGALKILANTSKDIIFDIYGPLEDKDYWAECVRDISLLPDSVAANYRGEVRPEEVEKVLRGYDLFFLPTLGENYGHVIREALCAGVPVLISDQTPWRGLEAKGVGADFALDDPMRFANWIDRFAMAGLIERKSMRTAALQIGNDPLVASENRKANNEMLALVAFSGQLKDELN